MSKKIGKHLTTVTLNSNVNLQKDVLSNWKEICCYAKYILSKIENVVAKKKRKVEIWEVSGLELGFTGLVSLKKIRERAFELGLNPLPAETVFLASLQHYDGNCRRAVIIPETHYSTIKCYTLTLALYSVHMISCDTEDNPYHLWVPGVVWLFEKGDK